MITIQIIDGELFYLVYTNTGGNLILVTRSNQLATITNAALKNKKDDSGFRLVVKSERRKKAAR
jgi:hypothetical protein